MMHELFILLSNCSSEKLDNKMIWGLTTLIIFASVFVHGVTSYTFSKKYSEI